MKLMTYHMYHMDEIFNSNWMPSITISHMDETTQICDNEVHEWRQHGWLKFPIWMKFNNMDESDFASAIDHINENWQQDLTHGW